MFQKSGKGKRTKRIWGSSKLGILSFAGVFDSTASKNLPSDAVGLCEAVFVLYLRSMGQVLMQHHLFTSFCLLIGGCNLYLHTADDLTCSTGNNNL
eukprot:scaffold4347_cov117-Cylindrotheca_fusiformis.AAC.3